MSQFTLLHGARQLLTLRGPSGARRGSALTDIGLLEDASVLIRDSEVYAVGSTRRLENLKESRDALEIDCSGAIVMPGFVDPNFHITLFGACRTGSRPRKLRDVHEDSLALLRSCLRHGTVAAEIKVSGSGQDFRSDLSLLRQITKIGSNPVSVMRTWKLSHVPQSEYEQRDFLDVLENISRRKLAECLELSAADLAFLGDELLACIRSANLVLKLAWKGGSLDLLERALARANPRTVACTSFLSDAEANALGGSPSLLVFSPGQELGIANDSALRRLIDAGAAVALSSGYDAALAPGFSMQMAVSLAIIQGRLTAEEAITAATINAAWAAGCAQTCGTLEAGKRADILVLNIRDYADIPRQFGINHVSMVFRAGTLVFNRNRSRIGTHEVVHSRVRSQHF